ncbi:SPRY-domain-containing protein [Sistotremastrum suecicum HHB10207 ss-3]|uniref:SPRY-domain-containing protein n=1 Tax=Sistotremastrum suecicum HHB10207 ss-3 TaxID=1314776 RepID=A0A166G618_9AGAM|nr:SPRY-domain-containing protein [Sistotremastrum suecicum HHB10207 ss-3]
MILLPLLIILSTLLLLLLLFLVGVMLLRRRRGIALRDHDGPVDLSRDDQIEGDGGFEGVESRWLESQPEEQRRMYQRAKEWQAQYAPNSEPTDITLSQFVSIQEKGVSAWSFEPEFEALSSLIVHSRTELTFLPDPSTASCVQSNLPLPKLNEVYYWEVKMFDLPPTTTVSIGLATKPYPFFRLPGHSKFSIAYHSTGEKSHNYPFTAMSFGSPLKEGDVLGVGYRPRTGTVFFTRNGRKTEDAFVGLTRWNLFPTVGADGPCSVHVNLGQAGFVFIEANVKKWGLAPSVGTRAPPPAYGSERGSILLESGGLSPPARAISSPPRRPSHRTRRPKPHASATPTQPSPLRDAGASSTAPPITPIQEDEAEGSSATPRYVSPSDAVFVPSPPSLPSSSPNSSNHSSRSVTPTGDMYIHLPPLTPDSPTAGAMNPPTPHHSDIHLQAMGGSNRSEANQATTETFVVTTPGGSIRQPPEYSPLDAYQYSDGVRIDLPAELIAAALEGNPLPMPSARPPESHSRRSRRR